MTIGFVGAGAMGAAMVPRIAAAGHRVAVHDRDARRLAAAAGHPGVEAVGTLAGLAGERLVVCMLPDSDAVEAVVGELLGVLERGALIVDMGSSDPRRTVALATSAQDAGIGLVDAAVSGGVARARTGELTVMFGGAAAQLERCRPVFDAVAARVEPMGPVGSGHAMKAINNLSSAAGLSIACEALALAARLGLDPGRVLDVLNSSTGENHATRTKLRQFVLSGSHASGFALRLMLKDLTLAASLERDHDVRPSLAEPLLALWRDAAAELPADADQTQIETMWRIEADADAGREAPASAQEYIDDMARRRGYVLDYHRIMAANDFDVLQAANDLVGAAYLRRRSLDRRTKELLFIVSLTVMRAPKGHIVGHIRVALELGSTPDEILEAIEIALPEAGVVAFQAGVEAWAEATGAGRLEPTGADPAHAAGA